MGRGNGFRNWKDGEEEFLYELCIPSEVVNRVLPAALIPVILMSGLKFAVLVFS